MPLAKLLKRWSDDLAHRSSLELHDARLVHYEGVDREENRRRLMAWLERASESLEAGRADLVVEHARRIAVERFEAGYELAEVQTSINIVEETLNKRILGTMRPEDATRALCMANALFSIVKDVLAQTYVSQAMQR